MTIKTRRRASWSGARIWALIALCAMFGTVAAEPKRVLLLHSFGRDFAPYDAVAAAFRTELAQGWPEPIAFYEASLDAGQVSLPEDLGPLLEHLRRRFASSAPDVVVTFGPPAAEFYVQHRETVFPGVPLVMTALDERLVRKSMLREGDAAVAGSLGLPRLVENILQLRPETARIAVVIGNSPLERFWLGELKKELAVFETRVTFEWLNELSMQQMRSHVAGMSPHDAVLYGLLVVDAAGVPHERSSALAGLLAVSSAPMFSIYETELGKGVVGGPYFSQRLGAERAAAAVRRVLGGQAGGPPRILLSGFEPPVYDWRELERWGIDRDRLPPGSEIRFRPPSQWEQHKALIIVGVSLIALQTALIAGLLWQRAGRRRAEREALSLSGRLIGAHEVERRRLARELHDDITQRLARMVIDVAQLTPDTAHSLREGLVHLSEDVHALSYRLHPSILDDLGLAEALKAECERVERNESLRVTIDSGGLPKKLPPDAALCLYRVAQEAMRNIGRHAKARSVNVSLGPVGDGLQLVVSDDGAGFDPAARRRQPSLGLASMRERVRLQGGRLDIDSAPGRGTTIVAWIPLRGACA